MRHDLNLLPTTAEKVQNNHCLAHTHTEAQTPILHTLSVCGRDSDQLRTAARQPQVKQKLPASYTRDQHVLDICCHIHTPSFNFFFPLANNKLVRAGHNMFQVTCNLVQISQTLTSPDQSMWCPEVGEFSHELRANTPTHTQTHTQPPSSPQLACVRPSGSWLPGCLGLDFYPEDRHCQRAAALPVAQAWIKAFRGLVLLVCVCLTLLYALAVMCGPSGYLAPSRTTHSIAVAIQLPQPFTGPHTCRDTGTKIQYSHSSHTYRAHEHTHTHTHFDTFRQKPAFFTE